MTPRIAVIGCGQWGQNHVRTLAGIGVLAAVADGNASRSAALAERFGVPALDPEAAIAAEGIDALVLALPAVLHGPFARKAFAAGKDVLIEKPIALDPEDARATADAAAKAGRLLMVGHLMRFHTGFREVVRLVAAGKVGRMRHLISNRQGLGRFLGMDAVWDLAPHDLSMVLHLAKEAPETVETTRRTVLSDATDLADIALAFPSGLTAGIHVSRVSPYRDRRFSVIGTEGMLVLDDLEAEGRKLAFYAHAVRREGAVFTFQAAEPDYLPFVSEPPLEAELRHFIRCIETREPPETGALEAIETVRILAAASPP
ncbi:MULTISPECIES: Gfo/Idh/MocA family protein [unclassified Aureimonas]|uniref:Gfo/Idh/MocA family protein n=1 Tax=unclassified Aureimonas TaxID=2615206 RepID=UPI0006F9115A|nr:MULTISPECIES: Gfo/Idh/MocA family oxidoreductase [unclassified Aureimonas]KQT55372.1 oxidoreductase [Aureimonas sp. Leaf427]KQT71162.1 oxidoreductase [Aureimonas sp. Leaf460]